MVASGYATGVASSGVAGIGYPSGVAVGGGSGVGDWAGTGVGDWADTGVSTLAAEGVSAVEVSSFPTVVGGGGVYVVSPSQAERPSTNVSIAAAILYLFSVLPGRTR